MIWIIKGEESHQIISSNVSQNEKHSELWITRPNGKGMKVFESKNRDEVLEMKTAIDYAIEVGVKAFTIE